MSVPEQQDNISEESLFEAPPMNQQMRMIEAILFATVEPMTVNALNERMPHGCDAAEALARLRKSYAGRGVNVMKIGAASAISTSSDLIFLIMKSIFFTVVLSSSFFSKFFLAHTGIKSFSKAIHSNIMWGIVKHKY